MVENNIALVVLEDSELSLDGDAVISAPYLEDLEDLLDINPLRQLLHIYPLSILILLFTNVIVLNRAIHTRSADLTQPPPKLDERVLSHHLVERLSSFRVPLPLPPLELVFDVACVETQFCHGY